MIARSKSRGFSIKVSTVSNGRPTSGWKTDRSMFWRNVLGKTEALYEDAMHAVPVEALPLNPDDWEITYK